MVFDFSSEEWTGRQNRSFPIQSQPAQPKKMTKLYISVNIVVMRAENVLTAVPVSNIVKLLVQYTLHYQPTITNLP